MDSVKSFVFLLALFGLSQANCPDFMSRSEWGARTEKGKAPLVLPTPLVVIHHTVMGEGNCSATQGCIDSVKEMQDFHMDGNGWDDIGYNFLIGGDLKVYEGRGWKRIGAHATVYNKDSIGIALIGNFEEHLPSDEMLQVAKDLIQCAVDIGYVKPDYILKGHRDTPGSATACPGELLYREIETWPQKG